MPQPETVKRSMLLQGTVPAFQDVLDARKRLLRSIHRTPVISCQSVNDRTGVEAFFKCENLQKTGSFKVRGAINAVAQLSKESLEKGVVTHSSGNHAAALSYAARLFGTTARIVMPSNSSAIKKEAVRYYGGQITECAPTLASREEVAAAVQAQTEAALIPPYDHPHIIAGQGTCAVELLEDVPDLDYLVCPIGGGGLMSGTCLAAKSISPKIKIIGAEPQEANDAFRSKASGTIIRDVQSQTIADGLRTNLGLNTWPFIRDWVDEIVCVSEEEIREALGWFMRRAKLVIEPSAAVGVAVLLKMNSALPLTGPADKPARVGVILCGGNLEL
jgi:threonine dehydratase/serine racemase